MNTRVELIRRAEYAPRRGVAESAVAKAVSEGRMSLIDGEVDPQVSNIQWERNTRARAGSGRSAGHVSAPGANLLDSSDEEGGPPASSSAQPPANANLAEMRYARERQEHISVAAVLEKLAREYLQIEAALAEFVQKVGPKVAAISDAAEVQSLLDVEVHALLERESRR